MNDATWKSERNNQVTPPKIHHFEQAQRKFGKVRFAKVMQKLKDGAGMSS